MIKFIRQIMTT